MRWVMVIGQSILCLLWFFFASFVTALISPWLYLRFDLNGFYTRLLRWAILPIFRLSIEWEGLEHFPKQGPCVWMFNHQSMLDLITMGSCSIPRSVAVGKKQLQYFPIFNVFWWLGRNLSLDRGNSQRAKASLKAVGERILREKLLVSICPEGTRNRTDLALLPFKKGGFFLAIQAQVPIFCAVISRVAPVFDPVRGSCPGGVIKIKFFPMIPTAGMTESSVDTLSAQVWSTMAGQIRAWDTSKIGAH